MPYAIIAMTNNRAPSKPKGWRNLPTPATRTRYYAGEGAFAANRIEALALPTDQADALADHLAGQYKGATVTVERVGG